MRWIWDCWFCLDPILGISREMASGAEGFRGRPGSRVVGVKAARAEGAAESAAAMEEALGYGCWEGGGHPYVVDISERGQTQTRSKPPNTGLAVTTFCCSPFCWLQGGTVPARPKRNSSRPRRRWRTQRPSRDFQSLRRLRRGNAKCSFALASARLSRRRCGIFRISSEKARQRLGRVLQTESLALNYGRKRPGLRAWDPEA